MHPSNIQRGGPPCQQLTITLPSEVAEAVKSKVESGEFASEGDVLSASFLHFVSNTEEYDETLGMGEEGSNEWLRKEAIPVLEGMKSDPSQRRSMEQVRRRLAQEHASFEKAG
jgi:Arc/MetJ-type ribon-helix-helix transcriptional regulator